MKTASSDLVTARHMCCFTSGWSGLTGNKLCEHKWCYETKCSCKTKTKTMLLINKNDIRPTRIHLELKRQNAFLRYFIVYKLSDKTETCLLSSVLQVALFAKALLSFVRHPLLLLHVLFLLAEASVTQSCTVHKSSRAISVHRVRVGVVSVSRHWLMSTPLPPTYFEPVGTWVYGCWATTR